MTWLAWLVLGILIGWIVEWLIDLIYWRRSGRNQALALAEHEAALQRRESQLQAREAEHQQHLGAAQALEQQWQKLRDQEAILGEHLTQASQLTQSLAQRERELAQARSELHQRSSQMAQLTGERYQTGAGEDNLEVIEGIGPRIAELLRADGVRSFRALAEITVHQLTTILDQAGPRFKLANPGTWAEQAALLADGQFAAFEKLKQELTGGVRLPAARDPS